MSTKETEANIDDPDFEEEELEVDPIPKCLCLPLESGMALNGMIMLGIGLGYATMLWLMAGSAGDPKGSPSLIVACLMSGSWSFILALTSVICAPIGLLLSLVRHPLGRLQMSLLNLFATGLFTLAVCYNGYSGPAMARFDIPKLQSSLFPNKQVVKDTWQEYTKQTFFFALFALIGFALVRLTIY